MKLKSLGVRLTASIIVLLLIVSGAIGLISYTNSSKALIAEAEQNIKSKAEDVSHYIEQYFARLNTQVEAVAMQEAVQSMDKQRQDEYLNEFMKDNTDFLGFGIVDAAGTAHYTDGTTADLADRAYIKQAFEGETAMSDIVISRVTNEPVIMFAAPIDTANGEKALLLARMDGYILSNVIADITIGETGHAFIVNSEGIFQGHKNTEYVKEQMNYATDKAGTDEGEVVEQMLANEEGITSFENEVGEQSYVGYHTLNNGMKMGVIAIHDEILSGLADLLKALVISTIIVLAIGIALAIFVSRRITGPIIEFVKVSETLATGDFTVQIDEKHQKRTDELGTLARSQTRMVDSMKTMVREVNMNAHNVSEASCELMGEVDRVNASTSVISSAMQEIDHGAVSQSTMADESAQSMEQMATGIQLIAEVASTVVNHTQIIDEQIHAGEHAVSQSMNQMQAIKQGTEIELEVIRKLERESQEIGLISKMITDISDQTNLLALNASIEAARAGDAGKGFAVVADEVRKLSEQTAHSAAQINQLIDKVQVYTKDAVNAATSGEQNVERGLQSIQQLESSFTSIIDSIEKITYEIEQLSASTEEMSANTEEVTASIEEMSAVASASTEKVHEVTRSVADQTATVETMASRATQLSEMAAHLQQTVRQFKL